MTTASVSAPSSRSAERRVLAAAASGLRTDASCIDTRRSLFSQGLDSLSSVELLVALSTEFGRELPDTLLIDCPSIESLARQLAEPHAPRAQDRADAHARMRADAQLPEEIRPPDPVHVAGAAHGVLLTGATGFLGAHVLAELVTTTRAHVYCLVRQSGIEAAEVRLRRALERLELWSDDVPDRVTAVPGDLARPGLGLTARDRRTMLAQVDTVIHVAAAVDWVMPYDALRDVNVVATRELLRLACAAPARFHFVSSLSVCYLTAPPEPIDEAFEPVQHLEDLHLGYAQSKAVAEALVRSAAARGLPATIYRPSLISGSTRSGISKVDDLLPLLQKGCIEMGMAPDLNWRLDCCSVDSISKAITRWATNGRTALDTVHLSAVRPRHWREFVLWLNLYGYDVRLTSYDEWLAKLARVARHPGHALHRLRSFFQRRIEAEGGRRLPELYQDDVRAPIGTALSRRALAADDCLPHRLEIHELEQYQARFEASGFLAGPRRSAPRSGAGNGFDPALIERLLRRHYADPGLVVHQARLLGRGSDHSIMSELTSWLSGCDTGLKRYRVSLSSEHGEPRDLDIVIKKKPSDRHVLDIGERVAELADPTLGREFRRHRHRLELSGSHIRELTAYGQADERFRRCTPTCYGQVCDPERDLYLLALEDLSGLALLDSVDYPDRWGEEAVEAAVAGVASLHSIWLGRPKADVRSATLCHVRSAEDVIAMRPLWEALAAHAGESEEWIASGLGSIHAKLARTVGDWWPALEAHPRTWIHNDFSPRNVAMRATDGGFRLCAYDWEMASYDVPQHDLVEFLCFARCDDIEARELEHWLERHRRALESAADTVLSPESWRAGFHLALCDLLVNRLAMYALVHRFRPQSYLGRVLRTWRALFDLTSA